MSLAASKHSAIILVAEDEPSILELFRKVLRSAGYHVLIASDGLRALKIVEHTGKIDLLLSDVIMPQMTGLELAKALKRKRPEIKIILTSAYPQGMLVMGSGWHFLPKPFLPRRLLEEVRRALLIPPEEAKPAERESHHHTLLNGTKCINPHS